MLAVITLTGSLMVADASGSDHWRVARVSPSSGIIPERLLRISIRFTMPQWHGLPAPVALADADRQIIDNALFGETFWSPDRRTATLLLHPGRVKTGLIAHETSGWALVPGRRVMLLLGGNPIHTWDVVAGGCTVPDLATWRVTKPTADTKNPLILRFPGPIDALSQDLIAVGDAQGRRIAGRTLLESGERRWTFTPAAPWPRGTLQILVHPLLESPCGDEPGEAFEHSAATSAVETRRELRRLIPMATDESPR